MKTKILSLCILASLALSLRADPPDIAITNAAFAEVRGLYQFWGATNGNTLWLSTNGQSIVWDSSANAWLIWPFQPSNASTENAPGNYSSGTNFPLRWLVQTNASAPDSYASFYWNGTGYITNHFFISSIGTARLS